MLAYARPELAGKALTPAQQKKAEKDIPKFQQALQKATAVAEDIHILHHRFIKVFLLCVFFGAETVGLSVFYLLGAGCRKSLGLRLFGGVKFVVLNVWGLDAVRVWVCVFFLGVAFAVVIV